MTRISVHKDNLRKGRAEVWVIEMDGVLYEATSFAAEGPVTGATGRLSYGPSVWLETEGPVRLVGAKQIA